MQMQKVKTGVSLATLVASGALLFFQFFHFPPKIDPRPHVGIGNVLAEQTAKALGNGGKIVLIAPDVATFRWPGPEVQLKAFHSTLRRLDLSVSATNLVKLDPARLVRVNAEDFINVLRKLSDTDVVVSLLGPPVLNSEQKGKLPARRARLIAVCAGDMPRQMNLATLFDENLLHVAIVSRPTPALGVPQTDDARAWFDHFYETAATKSALELLLSGHTP